MKFSAEVKERPSHRVACLRHIGAYHEIGLAIERIIAWAGEKGLFHPPQTQLLAIYYDDPATVDTSQLRSDACVTVPEDVLGDGEIRILTIPGGLFAVGHAEVSKSEFGAAWDKLVGKWMPAHGVEPDVPSERLCYEIYLNDPDQHPQKMHLVDICEPIRRA